MAKRRLQVRPPRDRWTGWKPEQQFQRLDMIANNTRFLILSEPGVFPNLASRFLAAMARRRPDDWLQAYGPKVLLAETFCDPECFTGAMSAAAGWEELGETKGYSRSNRHYTDPHGKPKRIFVKPLRPGVRGTLASPEPRPEDAVAPSGPDLALRGPGLRDELEKVPDCRWVQGRKHRVACVLAAHILAELANRWGGLAAEQFARALSQEELEAIGAWKNPKTGLREPVSESTIHRVVQSVDPEALEDVISRWSQAPAPPRRGRARSPGTCGHPRQGDHP